MDSNENESGADIGFKVRLECAREGTLEKPAAAGGRPCAQLVTAEAILGAIQGIGYMIGGITRLAAAQRTGPEPGPASFEPRPASFEPGPASFDTDSQPVLDEFHSDFDPAIQTAAFSSSAGKDWVRIFHFLVEISVKVKIIPNIKLKKNHDGDMFVLTSRALILGGIDL